MKDRFDGYQIETAIHQNCDTTEVSKLVRKYNNHTAMNSAQKAFTYVDTFAREIRDIIANRFFLDDYTCSRNDKKNGTIERVVGDTVLRCNYPDQYKKETIQGFKWLNENGTISGFGSVNDLLTRLTASMEATKEIRALFNSKHTHIFVAAFKAFTESGYEDTNIRSAIDSLLCIGLIDSANSSYNEVYCCNACFNPFISTVLLTF